MAVTRVIKTQDVKRKGMATMIHVWMEASNKPTVREFHRQFYGEKSRPQAEAHATWLRKLAAIADAAEASR